MKITLDIEKELIEFFRNNIDNSEPVEIMLVKMLRLLREILCLANDLKVKK